MLQFPDLCFIQHGHVRFFFGYTDAPGFQRRIQRIQPGYIVFLLIHGPADLIGCQGMAAGPACQDLYQFFRLRQFPHDSFSFQLQPEERNGQSSAGSVPCFFSRIDWRYRIKSSLDISAALPATGVPRAMRSR